MSDNIKAVFQLWITPEFNGLVREVSVELIVRENQEQFFRFAERNEMRYYRVVEIPIEQILNAKVTL